MSFPPDTFPMQKSTRKKKLINSGLQLRMLVVFLSLSVASALFQVVLLNRSVLSMSSKLTRDSAVVSEMLPGMLTTNLLLTLGVLVPLTMVIGVLATHRIAGPAYRMTQYCKGIAQGEPPTTCRIRKNDELHELCAALNSAFAAVCPGSAPASGSAAPSSSTLEQAPSLVPGTQDSAAEPTASHPSRPTTS